MISRKFWETHPALLFAFALLMGQYPPLFLTLPLFFSAYLQDKKKLLLIFSIALLGILSHTLFLPPKMEKPLTGIGYFHIHTLKKCKTSFSKGYLVQGDLKYFENLYDIPITLFYRYKEQIPLLEYDYLIEGTLFQKEDQSYQWKSTKKPFIPIKKTLGLAKKRYEWKETIRSILQKHLTSPSAYAFISALATAETHEYVLPILINKLGLGHLLAISGLHFTCLLALFSLVLLPFCREKTHNILLLLLASAYAIYLGSSPSLLRAFISSLVFLVAIATYQKSSSLNTLGVALFFLNLFFPQMKYSMGFILSFLATFSLIVFYPIMEGLLSNFMPTRCLKCFLELNPVSKFGYLILRIIKKSMALNLAISFGTLPALLYCTKTFPYLSLVYNMFFPFLTVLALTITLLALFIYPISLGIAKILFSLLNSYTHTILELIFFYPREWGFGLSMHIPLWFSILWVVSIIYTGLLTQKQSIV